MLLTILTPEHVRLDTAGDDGGMAIEGGDFGPLQMLAASLALCTASVIVSYAEHAKLEVEGLALEVEWQYVDDPYRVGNYRITLHVPAAVPQNRHRAIIRAADTCTVHQTLHHAPAFETVVKTFETVHVPHVHDHHEHHHHDHEA